MIQPLTVEMKRPCFEPLDSSRPPSHEPVLSRRVLVMEDERAIADVIKRSLTACDYDVDVVHDGKQGLKCAMSGVYSLVILDLILPRLDGLSICRSLRANGLEMPILILTGLGATAGIEDPTMHGADDLMLKPFDVRMLQQRVSALIREGAASPAEVRVGSVMFNAARRALVLDGALIPLTVMEFTLLEFLLRYRGKVVTYRLLGQQLWGSTSVSPLVIDILVNAIEMKSGGGVPIACVPEVGYRLE